MSLDGLRADLGAAARIAPGRVIWITGLSAAGKSTVGREVYCALRSQRPNVVFLDGDELRGVFGASQHFDRCGRLALGLAYGRLCKFLGEQGIDVVCATISLFTECHEWNRANIARYMEVFLDVPLEVLVARDPRGLYQLALRGETRNVVGVDLSYARPERPDLVLRNDGCESAADLAARILRAAGEPL